MNRAFISYKSRLDNLFKQVKNASNDDEEMIAHWAKYLCVRCAGFIEVALPMLLIEYARNKSYDRKVISYINNNLDTLQNIKSEKMVIIINHFDSEWAKSLQVFLNESGRKEAINSIVAQRHLIAHGKDSSMSFGDLKGYYGKLIEVFDFIHILLTSE